MNSLGIDGQRFTVAKNTEGEILGFGQIEVFDEQPPFSEVRSMFVQKDFRGQGIGASILTDLLSRPGVKLPVFLTTATNSIEFYSNHGFREITPFSGIPLRMILEWLAGTVACRLIVNQRCLIMRKDNMEIENNAEEA